MKLVLLDRDGVLNENRPEGIQSVDKLQVFANAGEAVALLNQAGFKVVVVTNQSIVGRGIISEDTLKMIHEKLAVTLNGSHAKIDRILFAPDVPDAPTARRKPGPGMLIEAMMHYHVEAKDAVMVGDSLVDMQAAHAAGCGRKILVKTGNGEKTISDGLPPELGSVEIVSDILAAVRTILEVR